MPAPGGLSRWLWLFPALLLVAAAAWAAASLFSDLYLLTARHRELAHPNSVVALSASEMATRLAPWKSEAWQVRADLLSRAQRNGQAAEIMANAVRWAPVDGARWSVFAQLWAQASGLGAPYRAALTRAVALAPYVPSTRRHVALQGVFWWRQGDAAVQRLWLDSMRATLKMDLSLFPAMVVWAHHEEAFCQDVGAALKLKQWCDWTAFMRASCYSGKPLYPAQRQYCETYGYPGKVTANGR